MTDDLHHLAAAYALDALDADERLEFEAHYPSCEICRSEVIEYRETAARLGTEPIDPPGALRRRVLAEVATTRQIPPRVPDRLVKPSPWQQRRAPLLVAAVAAAAVLIAGAVGLRLGSADSEDTPLASLLASTDIMVESLGGQSDGSISVAWSAGAGKLAVLASDLPEAGDDLVYALWILDADGATPAALFEPDGAGAVEIFAALPGDPSGWGVTLEPAGGSPQPTGEIIFVT